MNGRAESSMVVLWLNDDAPTEDARVGVFDRLSAGLYLGGQGRRRRKRSQGQMDGCTHDR
jgi:hypothetical protein